MPDASKTANAPSHIEGLNGHLLTQPRPDQPPQLTLFVANAEDLAKLQSDLRDYAMAFNRVEATDLVLAAINMIQASALVLNVNAFMAAMYSVVPHPERHMILVAMRDLFNWVDIGVPTSDLESIFGACRR